MTCPHCHHENPPESRYCNQCGTAIPFPGTPKEFYAIFFPWRTSYADFGPVASSVEGALQILNSPAALSLSQPHSVYFVGKVRVEERQPDDPRCATARLIVLSWHSTRWDASVEKWVIGETAPNPPAYILYSPLESAS